MDARLAEKAENLTRLAKEAESARIRHDMRVRERDECLAAGIRLEEEKRKLDRALTDGSADDALGEALPLLRERLAALEARRKEARTAEEELETAQNTRRNTEREAAFRKRESGRLAELEDSVRRAAERAEEELAALLNGKPPEQPREELAALRIRSQALAALRGSAARRAAALRNRDEKNRTRIQISADIAAAEKELGILREREKLLVGNEALCQEQIRIAASVSGLAEHRSALRDGVPCPAVPGRFITPTPPAASPMKTRRGPVCGTRGQNWSRRAPNCWTGKKRAARRGAIWTTSPLRRRTA